MFYRVIRGDVEYIIGLQNNDRFSVTTTRERVVEIFEEWDSLHYIMDANARYSYQAIVSETRIYIKKTPTPRIINFLLDNVLAYEKCSGGGLCFEIGGFVGVSKKEYDYYKSKSISY